jgi:hypothetical protein
MRILVLDHYYAAFADSWYARHPGLQRLNYDEQRKSFDQALFGETSFQVAALRALGHEAFDAIVSLRPAQTAFAREHGVGLPRDRWALRRRGALGLPWPRPNRRWVGAAVLAQIDAIRPDVVHVQCVDYLDPTLVNEMRSRVRLVVGQIAAPISLDRVRAGYGLVVSSLPGFVTRFRDAGLD